VTPEIIVKPFLGYRKTNVVTVVVDEGDEIVTAYPTYLYTGGK